MDGGSVGSGDGGKEIVGSGDGAGVGLGEGSCVGLGEGNCDAAAKQQTTTKNERDSEFKGHRATSTFFFALAHAPAWAAG
jgi:hypothetical protein